MSSHIQLELIKKTFYILLLGLFINVSATAQSKKEQKQAEAEKEFEELKQLIESREFEFQANWATPSTGRRKNLGSNANFLKVNKDSVNIYLPYFGSSSSGAATMTGDGGIVCYGPADKYKVSVNEKKKRINIRFDASDKNDTFQFNMSITNGGTTVSVNSNYRSNINYDGQTRAPKSD